MFPDLPLPPQPIVTRWCTWIDAAVYYAENFNQISEFWAVLDEEDAVSIVKAKATIALPNLKKELAFIKCNFSSLATCINKLQTQGIALVDALETFESVRANLTAVRGTQDFIDKFDRVVSRNNGFDKLKEIATILSTGKTAQPESFTDSLTPDEISSYKFAPITSCDVERSFSMYNNVLEDNRRSFVFENLKKHVVIYCNRFD